MITIQKLEDGLGVRLFDRNTRSVSLTRIGRELAPQLGRILNDLDTVVGDTRLLAQGQQGVVRLAVLPSYASGILPEIIAAFRRTNPQVSFVIRDVIASRVAELTRQEQVDLGIMGGALSDPDLEVLHRTQDHMHVVFPDGRKLGILDSVTIDDIAPLPLVLMDPATSVRAIVDAAFLAAGHQPIVGAEATHKSTAVGMVRAGLGVAILPGSAMEVRSEQTLRSRPLNAADFARQIALIKRRGRTLPSASESFALMLMKELPAAQGADTARSALGGVDLRNAVAASRRLPLRPSSAALAALSRSQRGDAARQRRGEMTQGNEGTDSASTINSQMLITKREVHTFAHCQPDA